MKLRTDLFYKKNTINCKGRIIDLASPKVMGIINITPDSFYAGSRHDDTTSILEAIGQMIEDGAAFIDIGAVSTRPGADILTEEEEKKRLQPVLEETKKIFPEALISVDTFRAQIAKWAVEKYGVCMINDVSGGTLDDKMFETIANLNVPYVLMHMRGTPETMVKENVYQNLVKEIILDLIGKANALQRMGVKDIILDPGFGFAKNIQQNFELLHRLDEFYVTGFPTLVGISRKSLIYKTLDIKATGALNGTTVLNTLALEKGASILRVHDVKAAYESIILFESSKK